MSRRLHDGVLVAALTRALEAIADGDVPLALSLLHGVRRELEQAGRRRRRFPCAVCGERFDWPGLRDEHVRALGHELRRSAMRRSA